jgi:uncharacterized protein DUF3870
MTSGREPPAETTPLDDVLLVAGYAQLPQSTGAGVMWRHLTIIVRIDVRSGRVVDASTTLATRVADTFVRELLIGSTLPLDQELLVGTIERQYFGNGRKAIIGAIRDLVQRLQECTAARS